MFSKELFGERLREARVRAGETQDEFVIAIGISKSRISEMENGKNTTTLENLTAICKHYHISADYLLGLTDDPTPHKRKE